MCRGVAEPKLTAMDAMIDKLTGAIFVFQIVVVMVLGVAGNVWKDTEARKVLFLIQYHVQNKYLTLAFVELGSSDYTNLVVVFFQQWYVQYPVDAPGYELLVIPLRFELLCSIMIPISIKVVITSLL